MDELATDIVKANSTSKLKILRIKRGNIGMA